MENVTIYTFAQQLLFWKHWTIFEAYLCFVFAVTSFSGFNKHKSKHMFAKDFTGGVSMIVSRIPIAFLFPDKLLLHDSRIFWFNIIYWIILAAVISSWVRDYLDVYQRKKPPKDWTCAICLDTTPIGTLQLKACNHIFHRDCIDSWLEKTKMGCSMCERNQEHEYCSTRKMYKNKNCPYCRTATE